MSWVVTTPPATPVTAVLVSDRRKPAGTGWGGVGARRRLEVVPEAVGAVGVGELLRLAGVELAVAVLVEVDLDAGQARVFFLPLAVAVEVAEDAALDQAEPGVLKWSVCWLFGIRDGHVLGQVAVRGRHLAVLPIGTGWKPGSRCTTVTR